MNYLIDTNVLCESTRPQPDIKVERWLRGLPTTCQFISVISVAEIRKGVLMLSGGKKRRALEAWLDEQLLPAFEGRILPLGEEEMLHWARMQAEAGLKGNPLPVVDSLIAATAKCHALVLATRNTADFRHCQIKIHNPWVD
ncbi:MAG: type II toxin-antitoxin system VapC family toxin [Candidatus Methylacidiphilales bacterium]|nr:type II toxin-antitoxin system VapC family toxin [Candidatus Methylacidiphilales bacterium]